MNKIALGLSIVALVLVGVLYYLHFSKNDKPKSGKVENPRSEAPVEHFKMAYFEMDSVESNYVYVKEIRETLRKKEENMNSQLNGLKNNFQKRIAEWQQKGREISQAESDAMNREYQEMQVAYENKKQQLDDDLKTEYQKMLMDVNKKISDFLKEYNKSKGYNYIITNEQSLIYYKDSVYNITKDVVDGLNAAYNEKKKKK
ncbi:MAG TPA: OmpH family outer membrane protein [Chitinophagaceae bacterium]